MSCNHMVNPFFKRIGDTVTCCKCGEDFTPEEYEEMRRNPPPTENPEGGDPDNLNALNVKQLTEMAKELGVTLVGRERKPDLIEAIRTARPGDLAPIDGEPNE